MWSYGGSSLTRVAVMPASHPAVRRITGLDGLDHIDLLPLRAGAVNAETPPVDATSAEWVVDEALPDGVRRHEVDLDVDPLRHVDVAHVHFGYDYLDPESASDMVEYLADARVPMVLTVHDIVYPSHEDEAPHRDHTATFVEAASR